MARLSLTPSLESIVEFDCAGVRMPRTVRRGGGGRRQRLRRMAGETRREEVWRLRDASFTLTPGESIALIGNKGSGREAILRLAAGTLLPDEGTVQRSVPIIPMIDLGRALHRRYTVRQNIFVLGGLLGMKPDESAEKLGSIVEFAGVGPILDKYLSTTVPLVRQRLVWSIAMAIDARAYAIEQVLIVGDREFRQQCWTRVDKKREDGVAFLLVSDSPRQFRRFCDRAILLESGAITTQTSVVEAMALLRKSRRGAIQIDAVDPDSASDRGIADV